MNLSALEIVTLGATPARTVVQDELAAKDLDVSPDGKTMAHGINGSKSVFVLTGF